MACAACRTTKSLEWRRGPDGSNSLCNACGLRYARLQKHLARVAAANASTEAGSSSTAGSGSSNCKPGAAGAASSTSPTVDSSNGSERVSASPTPSASGADDESRPSSPSLPSPQSITESVKFVTSPSSLDALPAKAEASAAVEATNADEELGKVVAPAKEISKGVGTTAGGSPARPAGDAAQAAASAAELAA